MNTVLKHLIGTNGKEVPMVVLDGFPFPSKFVDSFDAYCGAGEGLLNDLVPEKIWGIKISPACWNHDKMWSKAKPTWDDFHNSNYVFWTNINSLLYHQSKNKFFYHIRLYRAVTYFNAVDTVGAPIFWLMKGRDMGEVNERFK